MPTSLTTKLRLIGGILVTLALGIGSLVVVHGYCVPDAVDGTCARFHPQFQTAVTGGAILIMLSILPELWVLLFGTADHDMWLKVAVKLIPSRGSDTLDGTTKSLYINPRPRPSIIPANLMAMCHLGGFVFFFGYLAYANVFPVPPMAKNFFLAGFLGLVAVSLAYLLVRLATAIGRAMRYRPARKHVV